MKKINKIYQRRLRRKKRISSQYFGTDQRPRVVIYRSNRYIYAQVVNDALRITLLTLSENKTVENARRLGIKLAENLLKKGIKRVVFDRSIYAYHGRVAAIADGLRKGKIMV